MPRQTKDGRKGVYFELEPDIKHHLDVLVFNNRYLEREPKTLNDLLRAACKEYIARHMAELAQEGQADEAELALNEGISTDDVEDEDEEPWEEAPWHTAQPRPISPFTQEQLDAWRSQPGPASAPTPAPARKPDPRPPKAAPPAKPQRAPRGQREST